MSKPFVFDTVVLIKAALSNQSNALTAFKKADSTGLLVYSESTLQELENKLLLPKFDKYQSIVRRKSFIELYRKLAILVPVSIEIKACRDPKDDQFLALAVAVEAACIITSDEDLLVLHPFRGIPILSPTDFLNRSF